MKKIGVLLLTLLVAIGGIEKIVFNAEDKEMIPDCVVSNSLNEDYNLTIIANRDEIVDKEDFAILLIQQVCNNGFKRMMFSFEETGYPTGLQMTVYLTEEDWKNRNTEPYMTVLFRQENAVNGYNIVENYDKFSLSID